MSNPGDKTYKAYVEFVTPKQATDEKPIGKLAVGSWVLDVCFRVTEELSLENKWLPVELVPGDARINKLYFLTTDVPDWSTDGKSSLEKTRDALKMQFEYDYKEEEITALVGKEVQLVVFNHNGYPRVRYVNNPNAKKSNVIPKDVSNSFHNILRG